MAQSARPESASSSEAVNRWAAVEGSPFPDGVSWVEEEQAYNFALYSEHAESVTLLLYQADDLAEPVATRKLDHQKNKSARIWHCRIPAVEIQDARYYGYSIDGAPEAGGRASRVFRFFQRMIRFRRLTPRWAGADSGGRTSVGTASGQTWICPTTRGAWPSAFSPPLRRPTSTSTS